MQPLFSCGQLGFAKAVRIVSTKTVKAHQFALQFCTVLLQGRAEFENRWATPGVPDLFSALARIAVSRKAAQFIQS